MTIAYRITLEPDENTLLVRCPALPPLLTSGETEAEAIFWAHDAAFVILDHLVSEFEDIPPSDAGPDEPHAVRIGTVMSLRLELYQLLRDLDVPRVELGERLHWHPNKVNALFDLGDRSGLEELEAAFRALGRAVDVQVREAPSSTLVTAGERKAA